MNINNLTDIHTCESDTWERALDAAGLGVWNWDLRTGRCDYSEPWCRMLGYQRSDFADDADLWLMLVHPDDRERSIRSGDLHIAGETESIETELRLRHKDGHWIWVLDRGAVVERDNAGRPLRVVGVQTDITRHKQAERNLRRVNERFRLTLAASGMGIWHFDIDRQQSNWDARTREIFGLAPGPEDVVPAAWHGHLHPDDQERTEREHLQALTNSTEVTLRYRIIREDGEIRHVETLAKFVPEEDSSGFLVGTIRDVTDEVSAADALLAEKERYKVTLESISDAVISTDVDGRITFGNPAASKMLARTQPELVGEPFAEVFGAELAEAGSEAPVDIDGDCTVTGLKSGIFKCRRSPILSSNGELWGSVCTFQDVTEEAKRQRELAYAARHDALSGLLNRVAFDEELENAIVSADKTPFAILYIDLDHFKALNDCAGHAAGDEALRMIASSVSENLPAGAVFARLGGDEFAILLPASNEASAKTTADTVIEAVRSVDLRFTDVRQPLGCSVGIAIINDTSVIPADAMARADDACYAAKSAGRSRHSTFAEDTSFLTSGLTAARRVAELTEAIGENRIKLFGQEIRSMKTPHEWSGRIEILARLQDRDGKIIPPGDFIPAAERFGMASTLDRWIINSALSKYGPVMEAVGLTLGFNLSAQTLCDPQLWPFIKSAIEKTGAPSARIAFEITETAAVTCFETADQFVRNAREHGCTVCLDDFGSGLSSFDYLRQFPINCIKIDGSFVEKLTESRFDRAIVSSMTGIAKELGLYIVAEKIEDEATVEQLRQIGVTFGQGFHLHRPEPLADLVERRLATSLKKIA
ncbi:EAL domain-containing protein [Hoeflea sp. G2-23]|uniref:EAL domain-containing protein n=1 Tax=Hoeflea algicola TaxID=2983763 RepID=A0ABT3ZF48_9HYPH|nr:EAL domain-containing protein [Hoeflea algicola]MCY0150414.1 EAL domain-containing protein [Hoeflea algicola]